MPLVSVVVTSRDRPTMLREAVESVVAQTHKDIEIIIVLTGADRATTEVATEFVGVRIVATEPLNLATSRNNGLTVANGEWVSFLDDDDVWLPTKIEKQLAAAIAQGADLVTTNWIRFNAAGATENWQQPGSGLRKDWTRALVKNNYVSVGSLVRRDAILNLGGFDTTMSACEDWDMWRRMSHHYRLSYIDEVLMKVRLHSNNMSSQRSKMLFSALKHFRKMLSDTPPHLQGELRHALPPAVLQHVLLYFHTTLNSLTGGASRAVWLKVKTLAQGSA